MEHARRIAYGDKLTEPRQRRRGRFGDRAPAAAGSIGLENAGNNLMYADVRIKELATDTTAPTITVRNVPDGLVLLQGTPFTRGLLAAPTSRT